MSIPTVFIVGAPRCGTSSLYLYLTSHPQIFMSEPKEPHHFGSDIGIPWNPYADRQEYLHLFDRARDGQHAGEASALYLYSRTAAQEIKALSPSARIIIMLRDPVEMLWSLHAINLLLLNEDLTDFEQALAAEADRRLGRRIPTTAIAPLVLQYTALARYSEHVERYLEVFGKERVKCIFFEDLKQDPERVYRETVSFLGLEPGGLPDFKPYNQRRRWRSQRIARLLMVPYRLAFRLSFKLRAGRARAAAHKILHLLFSLPLRANVDTASPPSPVSPELRSALRQQLKDDVERLARLLGRDLSSWVQAGVTPPAARGG
jgi:hypothetical protein